MLNKELNKIEEHILGGGTWATVEMTFWERWKFFRDTGEWPGIHSKEMSEMVLQSDIDGEKVAGKNYCAWQKSTRAKEAGLKVK